MMMNRWLDISSVWCVCVWGGRVTVSLHEVRGTSLRYGVAMTSRLLKIIGLFCKRGLSKRLYSAKETHNFKEPTHRSHPIDLSARPILSF